MTGIQTFAVTTTEKAWGDETLIACTSLYTGKLLKRYGHEPYHRAGLQYHPDRGESAYLLWGEAWIYWVDERDVLRKRHLTEGMAVFIPQWTIHSFETIGDSVVIETSTPGTSPAVRVEDQYDITAAVES
jgi:mannose-6-phosphate isomerase-like protein (cupin superfamily)